MTAPVRVWTASVDDGPPIGLLDGWLSCAERTRRDRFLHAPDRQAYAAAHALLRWALATDAGVPWPRQRLRVDALGRPWLVTEPVGEPVGETDGAAPGPGPYFSLSHTRGLVAVAIAPWPGVGVDVEIPAARQPDRALLLRETLASAEALWVEAGADEPARMDRFFRLWTLKEAVLKALGLGLSLPMASVVLHPEPPAVLWAPAGGRWQLSQWQPVAGSWAALALDPQHGAPVAVRHRHLHLHDLLDRLAAAPDGPPPA